METTNYAEIDFPGYDFDLHGCKLIARIMDMTPDQVEAEILPLDAVEFYRMNWRNNRRFPAMSDLYAEYEINGQFKQ